MPRRLEFIGDSDTAGWCANGKPSGGDAADAVENAYVTWAMQLARRVNASEVMVEAVSGYGVTSRSGRIQELYPSTLAFAPSAPAWNFSSWVPDAVVVLIGPNDEAVKAAEAVEPAEAVEAADEGGMGGRAAGDAFVQAYLELCTLVATQYAKAPDPPKLVHVCGGSINGLDPCHDIQRASDLFNTQWTASTTRSYYTSITREHWHEINDPANGYLGCDEHYAPNGHAVLASDIEPQLRRIMGW